MSKTEHSPLPWKAGIVTKTLVVTDSPCPRMIVGMTGDYNRADDKMEADVQFIVTACNSYYENKAAIAELVEALEQAEPLFGHIELCGSGLCDECDNERVIIHNVRALIAKHKAKP